jgi:hypothetical protein
LSSAADKMGSFSINERTENVLAFRNENSVATGIYSTCYNLFIIAKVKFTLPLFSIVKHNK